MVRNARLEVVASVLLLLAVTAAGIGGYYRWSLDHTLARALDSRHPDSTRRVKSLLRRGASVNCRGNHLGATPLMLLALAGETDEVTNLLERGADVNARSRLGGTALHCAAANGRVDTVKVLLAYGADQSLQNMTDVIRTVELSALRSCDGGSAAEAAPGQTARSWYRFGRDLALTYRLLWQAAQRPLLPSQSRPLKWPVFSAYRRMPPGPVPAASSPVRMPQALQACYARYVAAFEQQDRKLLAGVAASRFTVRTPAAVWHGEQALNRMGLFSPLAPEERTVLVHRVILTGNRAIVRADDIVWHQVGKHSARSKLSWEHTWLRGNTGWQLQEACALEEVW